MTRSSSRGPTPGADVLARTPPHAEEAEKAVLGAILLDDKVLALLQDLLTPDDFYVEAHRTVYAAMLELSSRAAAIDVVTLGELLKARQQYDRIGGAAYLDQLIDCVPVVSAAEEHAEMVRDKAIARRLILACTQVIGDAFGDYGDLAELLDRSEETIFQVSRSRDRGDHVVPLKTRIKQFFVELEALRQRGGDVVGVPSGFPGLDRLTAGFQPADLVILAGRPSVGKTSFCLNLILNAAGPGRVAAAFFSLEMSTDQLVRRILSSEAGVPAGKLRTGQGITGDEFNRLLVAADRLSRVDLYVDDSPMLTIAQLRAKVRNLKARRGIGVVAIDYLQLMRAAKAYDSREREIAEISRGLKALAKELEIPVLALSQLSRDVEKRQDKRPVLADLRESGAIEQDADMVLFLHDRHAGDPERAHKEIDLIVAKHRAGPTGLIPLAFAGEFTRFESVSGREAEGTESVFVPPDGAF